MAKKMTATALQNDGGFTLDGIKKEYFGHIVGQEIAVERCARSVMSAVYGGEVMSPLFTAEPGCGKTAIANAYAKALEETAGFTLLSYKSPAEFRAKGEEYSALLTTLMEAEKYVIVIDEAHMINESPTIQTKKIKGLLMKAMDGNYAGQPIKLDDEISITHNRTKGCFILATNYPHKLDKSGAFQSRCDSVKLDTYSTKDLQKILHGMLKGTGVSGEASVLSMIARCGRGTARPMEKIVGELKYIMASEGLAEKKLTKEEVVHTLLLTKQFPRGLTPEEIKILAFCDGDARLQATLASLLPNLELQTLRASVSFLMAVPDGEEGLETKAFLVKTPQGLQTTDFARRYLRDCGKAGFPVPARYLANVETMAEVNKASAKPAKLAKAADKQG